MVRVSRVLVFLLLAAFGATAPGSAAGTAELLRDINQVEGPGFSGTGVAGPLQPAGDRIVFPAATSNSGIELWGSDGTAQGTRLLREILPGPDSVRIRALGTVRRVAVFLADDFSHQSFGLWRSDGTPGGTVRIDPDVLPCFDAPESAVVGNLLFFTAFTGEGCGVWKTDGTTAAVVPGIADNPNSRAVDLTPAGSRLFFFLDGALWVTDGTPAGTRTLGSFRGSDTPRGLTPVGSRVYFIAPGSTTGEEELWTSDGTPAGTRQVTRFFEPLPFRGTSYLEGFEGRLYFVADDGTGLDLWRTDGTTAGTRRVTDFVSTSPFIESFNEEHAVRLGGLLVFPATDSQSTGWHLWASGGTPATTKPLTDCVGFNCPRVTGPLVQVGNRAVFPSYSEAAGTDLWVTDGTAAGTRRLGDLCASFCDSGRPPELVPLLGKVFYVASDAQGYGLWRTDGTPRGTVRLTSLGFRPFESGAVFAPVAAGGRIYFAADPNGTRGAQLWSSDGTPEGSGLVTLIHSSAPSSSPLDMAPFAGGVVFGANNGDEVALWLSDGTTAGTRPIQATVDAFGSDFPRPVVSNGLVFFEQPLVPYGPDHLWRTDGTEAGTFRVTPDGVDEPGAIAPFGDGVIFLISDDETSAVSLWASDGTMAGTRLLFEMPTGPYAMWVSETCIYFLGIHGNYEQLWVSDGTLAGTHPLTHINDYAFLDRPELKEVGPQLFFTAQNRLWKSDGTAAGTAPVLPAGLEGSAPSSFVEFQGLLYFIANTAQANTVQGEVGRGLWRSDGTAAGTVLIRDVGPPIDPVSGDPQPGWLTVVGNRLYFAASDGEHGTELWRSDGTAAGTVMVRDIFSGDGSSRPSKLAAAQGRLYFVATEGTSGFELWESDGTAVGTRRVQDIAPGAASSNPRDLTVSGNRLFFVADDGVHGEEPWVLPLTGGGCAPSADTLCLGGRFRVEADWRDFQGNQGTGTAVALTADTGYFWFFDASNVEVVLKVLDGRPLNGKFWVFYGALSSVEYTLTVTDTVTGTVKTYTNPSGRLASVADTGAF